ncbi:putative quinol monooxygenase [Emcibacter sp. SYSU 3D8]|uniref:putative quinol monooxygenase n=1 Tax=Emcibacter sp. SYSU 3D8 TaxID=3133969 RepID=UPI0031FF0799
MAEYTLMFRMRIHEGKVDKFLEIMRGITEHTRQEPGNLVFELRSDPRQPNTFIGFHSYADKAAFDLHYNADYHLGKSPDLRECMADIETIELGSVGYSAVLMNREAAGA